MRVERREPDAVPLSKTASLALAYWCICFVWLLGLELLRSFLVLRFGGSPSYDEWTSTEGFLLSLVLLLFVLAIPVLVLCGAWVLCTVLRNPSPWETASDGAMARRRIYAGLICGVIGVAALAARSHLPMLWQRITYVASLAIVDLVLIWWVRRAPERRSDPAIELGEARRIDRQ